MRADASPAGATRSKSGQAAELRWSFVLDTGRWRWLACLDEDSIAASNGDFDTLADCMTDAAKHGYEA